MKPSLARENLAETLTPGQDGDSPLQRRISSILDEYLTLLEAGTAIEDDKFLAAHQDVADQIRPHLQNLRAMHGAMGAADDDPSVSVYEAPKQLGAYRLRREIGRGGQGVVYEAHDETLNRRVALKVLPFAALLDQRQIGRFNNEAQAAARLHHPHIVPVYAVGVDRGVHYYAMQYIEGAPLSVAIEQLQAVRDGSTARRESTQANRSISSWVVSDAAAMADYRIDADHFRHVARLGIELAGGLAHAHELGIVHRDIKPSNLLLDETGKSWIADFGLAHIPNDTSMTATGDILGTIRYMSPEQAQGRNAFVDHRTDIYSLGVTLYELLTLKPLFDSTSREEFMSQVGRVEPIPPRRINSAIPGDLENIILRAIELEPADRYAHASQLGDDLQRFLDGRPTLAKRATLSDRTFKWARRHRRLVATAAACLVLLAASLATATLMIAKEQSRTATALQQKEASFQRAQVNFEAARDIVDQLGIQTSESLAKIPGTGQVRRELLTKTKRYYDFLLEQSQDESLLRNRGVTLTRSARINEQLGDAEQALTLYAAAVKELQAAVVSNPGNTQAHSELLNCWNNEAMLLARLGQLDVATEKLQLAIDRQMELIDQDKENRQLVFDLACSQANLAYVFESSQQLPQSEAAYEAAIGLYRQAMDELTPGKYRQQLAIGLNNLSALLAHQDLARAFELCREAIEIQRLLLRTDDPPLGLKSELAISFDRLAELHLIDHRPQEAEAAYRNAVAMQRQLVAASPQDVRLREELATTLNHLGDLFRETKSHSLAAEAFGEAAKLLRTMIQMAPQHVTFVSSLGVVLYNQGLVFLDLDEKEAAQKAWTEGLTHQQAAVARAPSVERFQTFLDRQAASMQEVFPQTP
jgi:serine/threonine protein kinase